MPGGKPNILRLRFQGRPLATLAQAGDPPVYALEFDPKFLATGHDLSPLRLPRESLSTRAAIFRPGDSPFEGGLPGLIADSLPDSWGAKVQRATYPEVRTLLGRLAAVGNRGPGAITFEPRLDQDETTSAFNLAQLAVEADRLARQPEVLQAERVDRALQKGGSSLGGIHPKISAFLPDQGDLIDLREVFVGGTPPNGCQFCVLKFSPEDDEGGGAVEYAFARAAMAAGINVARPYLVHDGRRRHFACVRFDRPQGPGYSFRRLHAPTLSGLLHQQPSDGAIDYEDFIRLARNLAGVPAAEECFRRAVFNLLATNRDDHGRNHAFLYDKTTRQWSLSPAYDLNPNVSNVLIALRWLGSMQIPTTFDSLLRLAEIGGVSSAAARRIYAEVEAGVAQWPALAASAGVPKHIAETWAGEMTRQTKSLRTDARRAHPLPT